jgi:hypothetical protein
VKRRLKLVARSEAAGRADHRNVQSQKTGAHATGASAIGAEAIGTLILGAFAIGALAIGAVAIGRLAIGRARIRRIEIDELVVRRLRITEQLRTPDASAAESPHSTRLVNRDDAAPER